LGLPAVDGVVVVVDDDVVAVVRRRGDQEVRLDRAGTEPA